MIKRLTCEAPAATVAEQRHPEGADEAAYGVRCADETRVRVDSSERLFAGGRYQLRRVAAHRHCGRVDGRVPCEARRGVALQFANVVGENRDHDAEPECVDHDAWKWSGVCGG